MVRFKIQSATWEERTGCTNNSDTGPGFHALEKEKPGAWEHTGFDLLLLHNLQVSLKSYPATVILNLPIRTGAGTTPIRRHSLIQSETVCLDRPQSDARLS